MLGLQLWITTPCLSFFLKRKNNSILGREWHCTGRIWWCAERKNCWHSALEWIGGGADPKREGWADEHHMWRKAGTPAALALGDRWIWAISFWFCLIIKIAGNSFPKFDWESSENNTNHLSFKPTLTRIKFYGSYWIMKICSACEAKFFL